ncbi:hypothetical protein QR680_013911 [Steinernema hermaphroditum]|uniref:ShKT domain-containing protein n=1 Tax=Steinernema hermaphroditum TaxID=289476 RepID=A0AA39M3B2_9BILA|nr:hypothetical protein QR680_013911 [Steinernema hermaphroditum]
MRRLIVLIPFLLLTTVALGCEEGDYGKECAAPSEVSLENNVNTTAGNSSDNSVSGSVGGSPLEHRSEVGSLLTTETPSVERRSKFLEYPPAPSSSHIGVLSDAPVCVDIAPEEYCSMNRQFCDDPYLSKELLEKCAKTCQVCGGTKPAEPCVDKIPVCDLTITHCWDPEKIDYFSENCAKTCKFCTEPTTTTAPTTAYPTTTSSLCISGAMYDDCGVGVGVDHNPEYDLDHFQATNHFHDASKNDFPTHYNSKLQRQRLLALLLQE